MSITPKEALGIFSLVFGRTDDERNPTWSAFDKQTGVDASSRKELEKSGLIESEKQGRVNRVSLTEKGWAWAADNLVSPVSRSQNAARVLEGVLARLGPFLEHHSLSLAELVMDKSSARSKVSEQSIGENDVTRPLRTNQSPRDLGSRLLAKALALGGGPGHRVRLSDLRRALGDVSRSELDRLLLELQEQEKLVLYRIDDPADIQPDDEAAALMVAGNVRHILYLEP